MVFLSLLAVSWPAHDGRTLSARSPDRCAANGLPWPSLPWYSMESTQHEGFKIPSIIPQDLLLIQDLIGPVVPPAQPPAADADDSVDSSGESTDSVEEVEANLRPLGGKSRRCVSYFIYLILQLIFC